MLRNNKNVDKPQQHLEEVLEKLNANRGRIYYKQVYRDNIELMAIYKEKFMLVMSPTLQQLLGSEFNSTVKQWDERGYLYKDKIGNQKSIKFCGEKFKGYAIKTEIVNELGFDFSIEESS